MTDSYEELKQAAPEQLLAAALAFYEHKPEVHYWIQLGFKLAGPDGWEQVAPAWLRLAAEAHEDAQRE